MLSARVINEFERIYKDVVMP